MAPKSLFCVIPVTTSPEIPNCFENALFTLFLSQNALQTGCMVLVSDYHEEFSGLPQTYAGQAVCSHLIYFIFYNRSSASSLVFGECCNGNFVMTFHWGEDNDWIFMFG